MTYLLSKSQLQQLNIDTVERAIVFAAMILEIAEQQGYNSPETEIEIVPKVSRSNTTLSINGSFSLSTSSYYLSLGLVFPNLAQEARPIGSSVLLWGLVSIWRNKINPSEITTPEIPDYPNGFLYFEQYFLYYFFIFWASLDAKFSRDIRLSYATNTDGSGVKTQRIEFSINLPIDFDGWLLGENYINAVERVLTTYKIPNLTNFGFDTSILTNDVLFDNNTLLVN